MTILSGFAASNTTSMGVSITVVANCTVSAEQLAFGNNDPATAMACSSIAPAAITLSHRSNANASSTYTETVSTTLLTAFAPTKGGQNVPAGSYSDTVMVTVTF
jgi:spore coat protein U-like protein